MKKILLIVVVLITIVFLTGCIDGIPGLPPDEGYPPRGWSHNADITGEFYDQYYPEGWAGIGYEVYTQDGSTPPVGEYYIRLYSAITVPDPEYELDGEGTYNQGVFHWDWIDIPWD